MHIPLSIMKPQPNFQAYKAPAPTSPLLFSIKISHRHFLFTNLSLPTSVITCQSQPLPQNCQP
uniref:Uncharacterized protein n=1 Tax=Populus trichocarpa TaxID=3694 RepID=A0A2K2AGC2_POPTR